VVDLPGIYSLSPYTPEEVVSRNYILDEKPDCVINIVDATNLERNLYLTTQILEMDVPVVIALNMMDAVAKNGDYDRYGKAFKALGRPRRRDLRFEGGESRFIMGAAIRRLGSPAAGPFLFEGLPRAGADRFLKQRLREKRHSQRPLPRDQTRRGRRDREGAEPELSAKVVTYKETFKNETFGTDFEAIVADARYKYISAYLAPAETKRIRKASEKMTCRTRSTGS
jgi:ferrous iron transport protein B